MLQFGVTYTDSGERLQVNGTAKITGASSFGGNMTLSLNQNAGTYMNVSNSTIGSGAISGLRLICGVSEFQMLKFSTSVTAYKIALAGDAVVYNNGSVGDIAILNDFATGSIKFAAGSSSTAQMTLASTGALTVVGATTIATTSTTGYSLVVNNSGANDTSGIRISTGGANAGYLISSYNAVSGYANIQAGDNSTYKTIALNPLGGNVGIGMNTASYKLDVTGEARISSAIAIGTTPDTNNPFKILKNLNTTVGIKFENTNTSSLAFSAVQLGTDITGGTKFTNLVYASSGISASGVYNPDGTSLINNGNGGLNFLGNPIRMYTGGSNGVLRWDLVNDGFITHYSATAPTTSATDGYRQYSADVTAGNAAPHFRTENGAVIKLYQETTSVGNSIISLGGGNSVLDDTTFDGYTLRQIVKALRNQGILA